MKSTLTIVMYHYVRDLQHSRYPAIKGLDISLFREQLAYLEKHYVIVHPKEVIAAAIGNNNDLPPNAVLLTFDDGYSDHYSNVFPLLFDRNLSGMFFPTVETAMNRRILDLNKIHFVLASLENLEEALGVLKDAIDEFRNEYDLDSFDAYYSEHAVKTRFDPPEIQFIKRMTQFALPSEVRAIVSTRLFSRFVSVDERAFAEELYAGPEQLKTMISCGMYVGSHSATHPWMNKISTQEQEREIDLSIAMLDDLGAPIKDWCMCYPSGSYDDSLLNILRDRNCAVGLTTRPDIADFRKDEPLLLPRLDTNDLPKDSAADINDWTRKILN